MNKLKLLEYKPDKVVYQYIPENKGEAGEISGDFVTGNIVVIKRTQNDETGRYAHNATKRIAEYLGKRTCP